MIEFVVAEVENGARLDRVIATRLGISNNEAKRVIDRGLVRVDGKRATRSMPASVDMHVSVDVTPREEGNRTVAEPYAPIREEGALQVLHVDDVVVVVDKQAAIPTHPLQPNERGTVANRLIARYPECALASRDPRDGGFVHRLDLDTTGVLIAARTRAAYDSLRSTFTDHDADKVYWALVTGELEEAITIDTPLETSGGKARVSDRGLSAKTSVRPLAVGNGYSFVEAKSSMGRMHQIRAHLAHVEHPLVGDVKYGGPGADGGVQLHARAVTLPHPGDRWLVTYAAPLPDARRALAERLLGQPASSDTASPFGRKEG